MNKQQIVDRLISLPAEIAKAEEVIINCQKSLEIARNMLADMEADLINGKIDGVKIDGKNAEQRSAQLREATKAERNAITICEHDLQVARVRLNTLLNELKALRAVAGMLSGEVA